MELPFPTDLLKFIGFIVANGATIAVLLEQWPFFQKLSAKTKIVSVFVLTVFVIPLLGALGQQAISTLPAEQVATIQGYLNLALFGLYSYTSSQVAHGLNPLRTKTLISQTSSLAQQVGGEVVAGVFEAAGVATSQPTAPPAARTPSGGLGGVVSTESVTKTTSNAQGPEVKA